MKHSLRKYSFYLFTLLVLAGCEARYSKNRIQERPNLTGEFQEDRMKALDQIIEDYPNNAEALYQKARVLNSSGNYKDAATTLQKAIALAPLNKDYVLHLVEILHKQQRWNEGLEVSLKGEQMGIEKEKLYYMISDFYYHKNFLNKALTYNARVLKSSEISKYYYQKAKIQLASRDTLHAIQNLKISLSKTKNYSEGLTKLVEVHIAKKEFDSANMYLNKQLAFEPSNKKLLFNKAVIFQNTFQIDSAKGVFFTILKTDTRNVKSMMQLSHLYFNRHQYDSARYYAENAVRVQPKNIEAQIMIGEAYSKRHLFAKARQSFEVILKKDSTNQLATEALVKLDRKIAYLQRINTEREENAKIKIIAPISIKTNN